MIPARIYGKTGCAHCAAAKAFLQELGVPLQIISIDLFDPIINGGLEKMFGENISIPVLIEFNSKEVIVGFKPEEYERIAKAFHSQSSPSTNSAIPAESINPESPAPVVEQTAPIVEGTA